jgi:hypothetical protein
MDALAVFYFGKRNSGIHGQALDSVRGALSETEFKEVAKQFGGWSNSRTRPSISRT